mmetsp:Transcript_57497/g.160053  ORF Transcript_57497/g.160053 Transcript_57497/m.160053 type:complete len:225 (+) Transcript_57497:645-1319(+)
MCHAQLDERPDVPSKALLTLPWHGAQQVGTHVGDPRCQQSLDRPHRLCGVVAAAAKAQRLLIQTLNANACAVHAKAHELPRLVLVERARIQLDRDLRASLHAEALRKSRKNPREAIDWQQRRGATTEVYAAQGGWPPATVNGPVEGARTTSGDFLDDVVHIPVHVATTPLSRSEDSNGKIAICATLAAKRDVDVRGPDVGVLLLEQQAHWSSNVVLEMCGSRGW